MKKIVLCADDYGQYQAVTDAILMLVDKQRLSAVSCMTTVLDAAHAEKLLAFNSQIDIGLHLDLTTKEPSLNQLIINAFLGRLNINELKANINQQIDAFIDFFGCLPDFVDGHQHVHHLPMIREVLLAIYQTRFQNKKTYLRVPANGLESLLMPIYNFPKAQIIALTGAYVLKRKVMQLNIPHNISFGGIYDFRNATNYRYYFNKFLQQISNNGLIMCHPGVNSDHKNDDPIALARTHEYQYLLSDDFINDCQRHGITIARMNTVNQEI